MDPLVLRGRMDRKARRAILDLTENQDQPARQANMALRARTVRRVRLGKTAIWARQAQLVTTGPPDKTDLQVCLEMTDRLVVRAVMERPVHQAHRVRTVQTVLVETLAQVVLRAR